MKTLKYSMKKNIVDFIGALNTSTNDLKKLPIEELKEYSCFALNIREQFKDIITEKEVGDYKKHVGKYVKIDYNSRKFYMLVRSCFLGEINGNKRIIFQGVGFYYDLGSPYSDDNDFYYSTWLDIDICVDEYIRNVHNIITEITFDEFKELFDKGYGDLLVNFNEWNKIENET